MFESCSLIPSAEHLLAAFRRILDCGSDPAGPAGLAALRHLAMDSELLVTLLLAPGASVSNRQTVVCGRISGFQLHCSFERR